MGNLSANPLAVNCVFVANTGDFGGGLFNDGSSTALLNCTLTGNTAPLGGGLMNLNDSASVLTNCILWSNSDGTGSDEGAKKPNSDYKRATIQDPKRFQRSMLEGRCCLLQFNAAFHQRLEFLDAPCSLFVVSVHGIDTISSGHRATDLEA